MPGRLSDNIDIDEETLHLPRIFCLHGSGSNATIFKLQCRVLQSHLKSHFRLCFVQAPNRSPPGPGIMPVFEGMGPYYNWLRWRRDRPLNYEESTLDSVEQVFIKAMEEDDLRGATGEFVGLMGFSQGAKTCASILLKQQILAEREKENRARRGVEDGESSDDESEKGDRFNFRFGILLNGGGPLMWVPGCDGSKKEPGDFKIEENEFLLRIPTLHVHGLRDPYLPNLRKLYGGYCEKGSARLVEWDGDHRVVIRKGDVEPVVHNILNLAKDTGVIRAW